jgi:RNA polymerase sigma-70 factor, ECF subfamily
VSTAGTATESAEWVAALRARGAAHEFALARLHRMLLRVARREAVRRSAGAMFSAAELDGLAHEAAAAPST